MTRPLVRTPCFSAKALGDGVPSSSMDGHSHYIKLAAAYVRGQKVRSLELDEELARRAFPDLTIGDCEELCQQAAEQGLRLHSFKKTMGLPRVKRVIGTLRGIQPLSLLDVGSGRGVFLWSLLDTFPHLETCAIDLDEAHIEKINAVNRGGVDKVSGTVMDLCELDFEDDGFDVITALEVLEHIKDFGRAIKELVRVARSFILLSVPSKEDDNPEHINLFSGKTLKELFLAAGAQSVTIDYVLNHIVLVVRVKQ